MSERGEKAKLGIFPKFLHSLSEAQNKLGLIGFDCGYINQALKELG